jgi:hypothetical protein
MKSNIYLFIALTLLSCSKNSTTSQNPLQGSWTFTNEYSIWNHYDTSDSIYIIFDNTNHYEFRMYNNPADRGTYTVAQDSSFALTPADTTYSSFYSFTHFTLTYNSQSKASFSSDKYYFSKPNSKQLIVKRVWSLVNNPNGLNSENFSFKMR